MDKHEHFSISSLSHVLFPPPFLTSSFPPFHHQLAKPGLPADYVIGKIRVGKGKAGESQSATKTVTEQWLFDSIASQERKDPDAYKL